MTSRQDIVWTFLFLLSIALMTGCNHSSDGYKGARGQVIGKVTFEGKPIPKDSKILFLSANGLTAAGSINNAGEYSLTHEGNGEIPAVKYQVQISPVVEKVTISPPRSDAEVTALTQKAPPATPFPNRYFAAQTSKLEVTVKAGKNTFNFELEK